MHLNNVNLVERDHRKTSYVKFKLFKRDVYGLALVDTGNLVKGGKCIRPDRKCTSCVCGEPCRGVLELYVGQKLGTLHSMCIARSTGLD